MLSRNREKMVEQRILIWGLGLVLMAKASLLERALGNSFMAAFKRESAGRRRASSSEKRLLRKWKKGFESSSSKSALIWE